MTLALYAHPFSSYSWKAQIVLDEKGVDYEYRQLGPDHPEYGEVLARETPTGKFPLLVDGDLAITEASAIIDYLELIRPEPVLIPSGRAGVEVRMFDRIFDNYVMNEMQRIVGSRMGAESEDTVTRARATLDKSYAWLDARLGERWACGDNFSLADCAAAGALFYADWVHPIPEAHAKLKAYRARLLAHPSVKRAVDGARPYRHMFPGGAPDRD